LIIWTKPVENIDGLSDTCVTLNMQYHLLNDKNYGQSKCCQRHVVNVSVTSAAIVSMSEYELRSACLKFFVTSRKGAVRK